MNVINSNFVKKLGLHIEQTEVDTQKINDLSLKTFGMMIISFLINDKTKRP